MNKKESKEKIKREIPNYLPFDYEAVEAHLEKMAAKGWRLVNAGTNVWKYRQAEPARVKYAVTYAADASVYDSEPTESQKTLADFCARGGWVKVSDWAQVQIFCSEEEKPVPIETDEEIRLEVIKSAMKKNFIPSNVVLTIIMAFNLWRVASVFFYNPLTYLSSWLMLLSLTFWCEKKAVEAEESDWRWIRESENPQQWGADRVYEGGWYDDIDGKREYGKIDVVILVKDNRLVRVWSINGLTEKETGQAMSILLIFRL